MENIITEDRLAELESEVSSCINGEYSIEKLAIKSISLLPQILEELKLTRKLYARSEEECSELDQNLRKERDTCIGYIDLDRKHYELNLKYKDLMERFQLVLKTMFNLNITLLSNKPDTNKMEECKQALIIMCKTLEEIDSSNWDDRRWLDHVLPK